MRPDWAALADGRLHRLKQGKHFDGELAATAGDAQHAAATLGKAVRTIKDELGRRNRYLWVQFADQRLPRGEACQCGGTEFEIFNEHFADCRACGRSTLLTAPRDTTAAAARPASQRRLDAYRQVRLVLDELDPVADRERWYGRAIDETGAEVVLFVDYPLRDGERIPDPHVPGQDVHAVTRLKARPLERAVALGLLDAGPADA